MAYTWPGLTCNLVAMIHKTMSYLDTFGELGMKQGGKVDICCPKQGHSDFCGVTFRSLLCTVCPALSHDNKFKITLLFSFSPYATSCLALSASSSTLWHWNRTQLPLSITQAFNYGFHPGLLPCSLNMTHI